MEKLAMALALATAISTVSIHAANAAGGVCDLPSEGSWIMVDGDEQIGTVRLGETPSGLVMDGNVDGTNISYRMQACKGERSGMMVPNSGVDGPPEILLEQVESDQISLSFKESDGEMVELLLVKDQ